ncbi:signal recognition particle subunit SRP72 [Macrosteles quadrilineatus]|uniref:signal recognition particle subunit SRP72 n=1 Tax=Macrosteles quadrilineatus TaxID=74068 RepID=UPI0023E1E4C7|nr:signal recognition particle subunit SRP72 [Macrosteles quadrilineatus]
MTAQTSISLGSLYAELNKFCQNNDFERAVKSANKVLHHYPEETKAFHCKIVSLVQQDKFQEALQSINKQPKLSSDLYLEKAYCQYRLNQIQDAFKTVSSAPNLSYELKELKAQILYRLESYEECFDVYRDIIKNTNDDYEEERETNLSAVIANMLLDGSTKNIPELREHSYELAYNAACQLISQGKYADAEKKLKIAEKLCREALQEEEEDVEEGLGIIRAQQAYCLQLQGREKEAQAMYNAILKRKPDDIGLVAIASNNSITLNRDQNVFDSKKKIRSAMTEGLQNKLTSRQRKAIRINQCLLSVYTNQNELTTQLCKKLVKDYPDTVNLTVLVDAILLARDGKAKEAANMLTDFASKNASFKLEMSLAAIQLLLSEGNVKAACEVLKQLDDSIKYKPGIVSALVTLYMAQDQRDDASKILQNTVDWHRKNKDSSSDLSVLWRQAADFHLRGGEPAVAAKSLEELLRVNPTDTKTLAQLIIAYAQFDPSKAQALSKKLPSVADLTPSSDVDSLETSNWMMGTKVIKKAVSKVEPSPGSELLQKKKKRRKRKGKLPKNYDLSCDPDPERWLPKHERSTFRKKKDRRNKDIGKGTQGAATGAIDQYDITKMPSQAKPSPNPQNSPAPDAIRGQQRKIQHKKKKKGGKF